MTFPKLHSKLKNGFFLSSMMNITDGNFCSKRTRECNMIQLGAYLAEPPSYGKESYFLPPNEKDCVTFLNQECKKVRSQSSPNLLICMNLATPKLEWGLEAAECFYKAGGDLIELNVHGNYTPYIRLGRLRAMVLSENRHELFQWVEAFVKLRIPLIVKFRMGVIDDYSPILDQLMNYKIFGIHFNIRDEKKKRANYEFVCEIKSKYDVFLFVSGYVNTSEDARILFDYSADMVGIAEPTIKDPDYISRIVNEYRLRYL
jgi:tRNA-dihydrouridine synthase